MNLPGFEFDNSSSSTTNDNDPAGQTQDGSIYPANISGNSRSNISNSVTQNTSTVYNTTSTTTDHGAIEQIIGFVGPVFGQVTAAAEQAFLSAGDIVKYVVGSSESISLAAIQSNNDTTRNALEFGASVVNDAFDYGKSVTRDSIAGMGESIGEVGRIANEALYQSQSVVGLTEKITAQNSYFMQDIGRQNTALVGDVIQTVTDLEESRLLESGNVIKTIKELAEVVQTGGESIQTNVNKLVTLGALAVAALIAWRALA